MTTFITFTKRLAIRLETFKDAERVRETTDNIINTISNEFEIVEDYNRDNGTSINSHALMWLAYQQGKIPSIRKAQRDWLEKTCKTLRDYKTP